VAIWGWRRSGFRPRRPDFVAWTGLALIGVTVLSTCFHLAIRWLPAHQAAILFSGNPVFVALIAPSLLGERIGWRGWGALGLALAGMGLLLAGYPAHAETGGRNAAMTGVSLMMGAMFCFALYTVLSKKVLNRHGAVGMTSAVSLLGSLVLLPWVWIRDGWPLRPLSPGAFGAVVWLALITTAFAYVLYFAGLRRVDASRGAMLFFLKPVAAAALAAAMLGEHIGLGTIAGAALILGGTGLAMIPRPGSASDQRGGSPAAG
jgi:drug/metabolite transporter (DMT)-like permease